MTAAVVLGCCVCGDGSGAYAGFFSDASSKLFGGGAKRMALAPIVGAPPNVVQQLTQSLVSAGKDRNLTLLPGADSAPYTIRGYLVASTEKRGAKISYIWDISDAKGQRVGRVSGDELIASRSGSDPWSGVDSAALNSMAAKITAEIVASLSGGGTPPEASPAPPPASGPPTSAPSPAPAAPAATATPEPPGEVMALVTPVSGAPGDGQKSLTAALKKRLFAGGVKLASAPAGNVYTVKGSVTMSNTGGKQGIRIDWLVLNPNGTKRGTVSQQNTVAKGMLDGPWGAIADAAAADAAKGIIKLLPRPST